MKYAKALFVAIALAVVIGGASLLSIRVDNSRAVIRADGAPEAQSYLLNDLENEETVTVSLCNVVIDQMYYDLWNSTSGLVPNLGSTIMTFRFSNSPTIAYRLWTKFYEPPTNGGGPIARPMGFGMEIEDPAYAEGSYVAYYIEDTEIYRDNSTGARHKKIYDTTIIQTDEHTFTFNIEGEEIEWALPDASMSVTITAGFYKTARVTALNVGILGARTVTFIDASGATLAEFVLAGYFIPVGLIPEAPLVNHRPLKFWASDMKYELDSVILTDVVFFPIYAFDVNYELPQEETDETHTQNNTNNIDVVVGIGATGAGVVAVGVVSFLIIGRARKCKRGF